MVRKEVVLNYIGKILIIIGIAMLTSLIWAIYFGEPVFKSILSGAAITIFFGILLSYIYRHNYEINYREGFAIVTLGWLSASLFGSLPFVFSGYFPTFADAFFETVSGFTTTGASILIDIEALPYSLLFWRSLTQWLGGMGIMVLFVAIIASMGVRANQLFRAEIPGGAMSEKLSPRIRETAKLLWITYVILSLILFIFLISFGMNIFDALCHTFTTMATGGFSTKNESIAFYNAQIQWIIIVFMFLAGANFSLYYFAYKNRTLKRIWQNSEFKIYTCIVLVAAFLVFISLKTIPDYEERIRTSLFQVVSILTTTGFATADYEKWNPLGQSVIFLLMFIGGCAGSTAGNIKVGRYMIMLKRVKIELEQMLHPKALISLRFEDKVLSNNLVINVLQYFFLYIILVLVSTLILAALDVDRITSFTASLSCISNIGPGFGIVGPTENYSHIPYLGKYILSILMLIGRLEIYPALILFMPTYWKE
ncbi:trk system potassium uptake protein TrkH [Thermosyntropha lipolytica DSM 11003]|uniref:Trk system potassium uptake protein TrkH n=1 Tax=Thermosyntropha lipolytica DSM 11003 TaxID=1123382 RepID=A0A1M5LBN0_9FIRM|nr:TrkH family potassium uptake protein [Thermosyntropha lipolytica]SHG62396.1 trk system potassium uptake protein TrkH [Thermosyntropha lipolytica DSM 11003]